MDAFPPQQQEQVRVQLSSNLIAVICQALIPDVTGHKRVAAFEIMMRTDAISNLIRQQKVYQIQSEIQTGMKHGMILLDDSLAKLFHSGRITEEEAMNRCRNVEEMAQKLAGAPRATPGDVAETGPGAAASKAAGRPQVLIGPAAAAAAAAKRPPERK